MGLITYIGATHVGVVTNVEAPSGVRPCDRCGRPRAVNLNRQAHNLCRDCVTQLTPEQLAVWV